MVLYNFKKIEVVPTAKDFIDVLLSKTQRKTPTVVHKGYSINRIRQFYMRKVKFTHQNLNEKIAKILQDFPRLDDIHPFYADLLNVLYDRDHFKLALGQVHTARNLVDNVSRDYLRMMKYADSLYRAKQLKRAALGRMCTIVKKLGPSLAYLEQVRQHMARLPGIDPSTRSLVICGYPNVGKSSFLNKVTRANVEVQAYPFTTKSLYVGHMDYKYLRWQVIDTPGILDHPLEERNTIEMQSITALAHLRAAVMYFIDVSEDCGYTIAQQVALFHSIKPLFSGKPLLVVANKMDLRRMEDLGPAEAALVQSMLDENTALLTMSNQSEEGVAAVKTAACDRLLEFRVATKLKGKAAAEAEAAGAAEGPGMHLAVPAARDGKARPPIIPPAAMLMEARKTQKQRMLEGGGAGVYSADFTEEFLLRDDEWRSDVIPELMDGKNIADFVDPDILARLDELEREEEERAEDQMSDEVSDLGASDEELVTEIRARKKLLVQKHREAKGMNRAGMVRKHEKRSAADVDAALAHVGIDEEARERVRSRSVRGRSRTRRGDADGDDDGMDVDGAVTGKKRLRSASKSRARSASASRAPSKTPNEEGLADEAAKAKTGKLGRKAQFKRNKLARAGEADRHVATTKVKYLLSGKSSKGTRYHR